MLEFGSRQLISCVLISRVKKYCRCSSQTGVSARGLLLFKCLASHMSAAFALAMDHILSIQSGDENECCLPAGFKPNLLCTVLQPPQSQFAVHMLELMTGAEPFLLGSNNEQREAHESSVLSRVPTKLGLHSNGCWKGFREFLGVMQVY